MTALLVFKTTTTFHVILGIFIVVFLILAGFALFRKIISTNKKILVEDLPSLSLKELMYKLVLPINGNISVQPRIILQIVIAMKESVDKIRSIKSFDNALKQSRIVVFATVMVHNNENNGRYNKTSDAGLDESKFIPGLINSLLSEDYETLSEIFERKKKMKESFDLRFFSIKNHEGFQGVFSEKYKEDMDRMIEQSFWDIVLPYVRETEESGSFLKDLEDLSPEDRTELERKVKEDKIRSKLQLVA